MEDVDVFVDFNGLARLGADLRTARGYFAGIARPADIRADSRELGGSEVSDAVVELGARWQHRYDALEQDLKDANIHVERAVGTYVATETDLLMRCADGVATFEVVPAPPDGPRQRER